MLVFVLNKCFINSSLFYLFLIKCLWVRCHFIKQCPRNAPAQLPLQGFKNKTNKQTPKQTSIVWIINGVLPSDENYPLCQIYSPIFFLAVFDRLIDLFFMAAARHPAEKKERRTRRRNGCAAASSQQSQTSKLLWLLSAAAPAVTRCGLAEKKIVCPVMQRVFQAAFKRHKRKS